MTVVDASQMKQEFGLQGLKPNVGDAELEKVWHAGEMKGLKDLLATKTGFPLDISSSHGQVQVSIGTDEYQPLRTWLDQYFVLEMKAPSASGPPTSNDSQFSIEATVGEAAPTVKKSSVLIKIELSGDVIPPWNGKELKSWIAKDFMGSRR